MLALMTPASVYPSAAEINSRARLSRKPAAPPSSSSRPIVTSLPSSSHPTLAKPAASSSPSPSPSSATRDASPISPAFSEIGIHIEEDDEIDIHAIPPHDLLKMLASLLTQIAQQNDSLVPHNPLDFASASLASSSASSSSSHRQSLPPDITTASRLALESPQSMLTFHARNIPTITLEAYLLRILKYCPTTNEVFLALLVYFERMGKLSREMAADASHVQGVTASGKTPGGLVIDSYNVHRLVIAGVTVASKFFSDVFYTNSRYAKVGGLPQTELNQLELQFLLLNNFTLPIPHDEMQRYARELVRFAQRQDPCIPLPATAIKKASKTKTPINAVGGGGGSITPPNPEQLKKQQEMGAIDAYGGSFPNSVHPPAPATSSKPPTHSSNSSLSGPTAMVSHPFLPSSSSASSSSSTTSASTSGPHPFLPPSTSQILTPSSSSNSTSATKQHFLQPGAHGFDHSQGFGYTYDPNSSHPTSQATPSSSSSSASTSSSGQTQPNAIAVAQVEGRLTPGGGGGGGLNHRPRLPSTSSAQSDTSSLFTSDSEIGDTETEDGSTEDEPTIRPTGYRSERGSICSFASSSTTSLYSDYGDARSMSEVEMISDTDEEGEEEEEENNEGGKTPEMNAAERESGERTPETMSSVPGDSRMASP